VPQRGARRHCRALNYEALKTLAESLDRPVGTLIALSSQNDPFYAGVANRQANAEWFAELWERLDLSHRTQHLRRIHYILVSQTALIQFRDGTLYTNTQECWESLCKASKDARYLGLVPSESFEDRRNPDPIINLDEPLPASLDIDSEAMPEFVFGLPSFPAFPNFVFNQPTIAQRYQVELWIEKSTMTSDVMLPLSRRYNLNIVSAIGEISYRRCRELVERAVASGRPVRILYISDFDPAGMSMPVAASRKIEFCLRQRSLDLDIQLRPIALTHEQCVRYHCLAPRSKRANGEAVRSRSGSARGRPSSTPLRPCTRESSAEFSNKKSGDITTTALKPGRPKRLRSLKPGLAKFKKPQSNRTATK
jgi:hypothetical protein